MHKNTKNLLNKRFGKLLVIEYIGNIEKRYGIFWKCLCDCGNTVLVHRKELCNSDTQSCGCIKTQAIIDAHWEGYEEISKDFYSSIIRGAKARKIDFNITMQEMWELYIKQNKKCALSGVAIYFTRNRKKGKPTASLDRVDSSKPYSIDNIQWVHKNINLMKNVFSNDHFINLCKLVTSNMERKKMSDAYATIAVSGGFDCLHSGHVRMILEAAQYGEVIVIANSDEWLTRKKGKPFMHWEERAEILSAIKGVVRVVKAKDDDGTVCETLRELKPTYFANGGDRTDINTPESSVCAELGITMLWGVGGGKIQSSSWLISKAKE